MNCFYNFIRYSLCVLVFVPPWWFIGRVFASHTEDIGVRSPDRDRPKTLKQIVTAPLTNARQQV